MLHVEEVPALGARDQGPEDEPDSSDDSFDDSDSSDDEMDDPEAPPDAPGGGYDGDDALRALVWDAGTVRAKVSGVGDKRRPNVSVLSCVVSLAVRRHVGSSTTLPLRSVVYRTTCTRRRWSTRPAKIEKRGYLDGHRRSTP